MTLARQPSDDDFARAWRELHKPDWPTLDELTRAAGRYSLIRARATALANGLQPDALPITSAPAPKPAAPVQTPAPHFKRRREDGPPAIDHKLAASGEYARHDTE